jgi:hypothetical protein
MLNLTGTGHGEHTCHDPFKLGREMSASQPSMYGNCQIDEQA